MKTTEQKRREAYDRMVRNAQSTFRAWVEIEERLETALAKHQSVKDERNVHVIIQLTSSVDGLRAQERYFLSKAQHLSRQVWDFHHRYGYPLPTDIHSFYNR